MPNLIEMLTFAFGAAGSEGVFSCFLLVATLDRRSSSVRAEESRDFFRGESHETLVTVVNAAAVTRNLAVQKRPSRIDMAFILSHQRLFSRDVACRLGNYSPKFAKDNDRL